MLPFVTQLPLLSPQMRFFFHIEHTWQTWDSLETLLVYLGCLQHRYFGGRSMIFWVLVEWASDSLWSTKIPRMECVHDKENTFSSDLNPIEHHDGTRTTTPRVMPLHNLSRSWQLCNLSLGKDPQDVIHHVTWSTRQCDLLTLWHYCFTGSEQQGCRFNPQLPEPQNNSFVKI